MKTIRLTFNAVCIIILLFFLGMISIVSFTRLVLFEHFHIDNIFTSVLFSNADFSDDHGKSVKIDWQKLYPLEDVPKRIDDNSPNIFKRYSELSQLLKDRIESYATEHLIARPLLSGSACLYDKTVRWNYASIYENHGIIQTLDGYLVSTSSFVDVKENAESFFELSKYCEQLGILSIYVNAPEKICQYKDVDINNILSFSNKNAESFLSFLDDFGVENYDLREFLHEEGLSHHESFYRTDHHWRPETGRWAAQKIAEILKENHKFQFDLKYFDPRLYSNVLYPNNFLGYHGRKGTLVTAKPEDFSLPYPNFQNRFHYEIKNLGIDETGLFPILYNVSKVEQNDYYKSKSYDVFIYGNQPLERIENKDVLNNSHVLIIHDSFGNVVVPFFALCCRYTDSIDIRAFDGSLQNFIKTEKPDAVIVVYNSNVFNDVSRSLLFAFQ